MESYTLTLTASDGRELGRWDTAADFGDLNELVPLMLLTAEIRRCIEARREQASQKAQQVRVGPGIEPGA